MISAARPTCSITSTESAYCSCRGGSAPAKIRPWLPRGADEAGDATTDGSPSSPVPRQASVGQSPWSWQPEVPW